MARSLGDHVCSRVGVIATPEVKSFETTADDALIVIASDGVWEFLENEEVIAIVSQHSTAQQARAARGPSHRHRHRRPARGGGTAAGVPTAREVGGGIGLPG
jgi:serine/threonine protein phosphatase PrpC